MTPHMEEDDQKRRRRRMKERTGNTTTTTANIAADGPTEREEGRGKRDLSSLALSTAQETPEIGEWVAEPESDHSGNNK